ncbi:MAG: GNAT family N-acetyltransferase [Pseudomonadota bacterium]
MTEFRTATEGDVALMLAWAAAEGWNPGLDDAPAFRAADPAGFFVALDKDAPVASISVVNHTDDFAFLGLYIALPAYRGKGIGYGLWQHALAHAGQRTIGLDGVPDQQANYTASGFLSHGSTTRYIGEVAPVATDVRFAAPEDIAGLIEREAEASGVQKAAYLSAWFSNTAERKTLVTDDGFCTVRRCQTGVKVGPLLAETIGGTQRLLHQASAVMGPKLVIDVPASSTGLAELCQRLDFAPGFATARMYRGDAPTPTGSIFAVTSLELG